MSQNPSSDEYSLRLQLHADGYQSALREIGQALFSDDTLAARQRAGELSKRLNRRPLSECQAVEVISAVVGMLETWRLETASCTTKTMPCGLKTSCSAVRSCACRAE